MTERLARLRARLAGLPLRARLVAGFSATMFLVLTAAGGFVYWRVQYALDRQLNGDLTSDAHRVAPYVRPDGKVGPGVTSVAGGELYQVLDAQGRLLTASPAMPQHPLISPQRTAAALEAPMFRNIGDLLPTTKDPLRVYATALPGDHRAAVLLVAVRRDHRDEALLELLAQLALAGLGALVATAVVGDLLARFALRPVERYRAQAADIASGAAGVRLDVPPGRDDEVTRLGDTLNAMLEALEGAVERERRFVDDASHELRTPLTLLTTRLQLARRRPRTVAEHEAVLAEIETDVVRLVQLAEHLLEVGTGGRVDDGGCDLAAVVGAEVERRNAVARATLGASPVRATLTEAAVPLSEAAAGQLVANLLENAQRYGAAPVAVVVDRVAQLVCLQVSDAGPGMEPELLETATRRFARADSARGRGGFGLGLSLVETLVSRAQGELRLCCRGHHARYGARLDVPCTHGEEMTVTVLLPSLEQEA
ncbi:ATP-binding protein [Nocardioides panaciterrulae]|uniref:histidine kinase n=1 Tax=Nocardioides panaciterrulae TaxID=661492 RepID=A0A7Y9EAE3_9ACTN|nr:ATP-binding protein [Nocardioides panaciterrulae]NYD43906.1 signal transduction histidine kinase [Nocardioides panaciterrulae]